jgi:hypothetical protein
MNEVEMVDYIVKILKLPSKDHFLAQQNIIMTSLWNFQKKFVSPTNNDVFTNASAKILESDEGPGCRWRFYLCAASIGIQGATILAACEGATVGIGTPACIAAAAVFAANGIAECKEKYCK